MIVGNAFNKFPFYSFPLLHCEKRATIKTRNSGIDLKRNRIFSAKRLTMCGITGVCAISKNALPILDRVENAVNALNRRGPDFQATFQHRNVALGHARLSIIDTSEAANQPFQDASGRYTIVFNGEIYNYLEIKTQLEQQGYSFRTSSDTEVLLYSLIAFGTEALQLLNGFFAFCFHDAETNTLLLARDRMGIKPLYYSLDDDRFVFGSELKAMVELGLSKALDYESLYTYFQLNYIPAPYTIYQAAQQLLPGHFLRLEQGKARLEQYYQVDYAPSQLTSISYDQAQQQFTNLLERSVQQRMVADVPLGSFLSGGTDSSIIAALAARHTNNLHTFSIGFADEPFYDETQYAREVAQKIGTEHTVFSLRNSDLFEHFDSILNYLDEPFADSSAIAVYILSRETRKHVTVALSGDGADELFSGYNKHEAEMRVRRGGMMNALIKGGSPLWKALPQSRQSKVGNIGRQLNRFADGLNLSAKDRYWRWASFMPSEKVDQLLLKAPNTDHYNARKAEILRHLSKGGDFNEVLLTDSQLVLPNDMLTKVDRMSMANSLEVRTPFLDHHVVDFAFQLPVEYKINAQLRKRILQDSFRSVLPESLYNRKKQGFEVPLQKWYNTELHPLIHDDLLSDEFVRAQDIFDLKSVQQLKQAIQSNAPGEATLNVWALLVFQHWFKRYQ